MVKLSSLLIIAAALSSICGIVVTNAQEQEQDDVNYPSWKDIPFLPNEYNRNNFFTLPASSTIHDNPPCWPLTYYYMPKVVDVRFTCNADNDDNVDLKKMRKNEVFPLDFMFEMLVERFNKEMIKEFRPKTYEKFEPGQELTGIKKIGDFSNELDDFFQFKVVEGGRRQLRGGAGGDDNNDHFRQLARTKYAECPNCQDDDKNCVSNFCMVLVQEDEEKSSKSDDNKSDDDRRRLGKKELDESLLDKTENDLKVELLMNTATQYLQKSFQYTQMVDKLKKEGKKEASKIYEKIAYEMESKADVQIEISHLVRGMGFHRAQLKAMQDAPRTKNAMKAIGKRAEQDFKDKQELLEIKTEQLEAAKERAYEEKKARAEAIKEVEKYTYEWEKAVDTFENYEYQMKAVGVMEMALNIVAEWFVEVYDVDCKVDVVRLA